MLLKDTDGIVGRVIYPSPHLSSQDTSTLHQGIWWYKDYHDIHVKAACSNMLQISPHPPKGSSQGKVITSPQCHLSGLEMLPMMKSMSTQLKGEVGITEIIPLEDGDGLYKSCDGSKAAKRQTSRAAKYFYQLTAVTLK